MLIANNITRSLGALVSSAKSLNRQQIFAATVKVYGLSCAILRTVSSPVVNTYTVVKLYRQILRSNERLIQLKSKYVKDLTKAELEFVQQVTNSANRMKEIIKQSFILRRFSFDVTKIDRELVKLEFNQMLNDFSTRYQDKAVEVPSSPRMPTIFRVAGYDPQARSREPAFAFLDRLKAAAQKAPRYIINEMVTTERHFGEDSEFLFNEFILKLKDLDLTYDGMPVETGILDGMAVFYESLIAISKDISKNASFKETASLSHQLEQLLKGFSVERLEQMSKVAKDIAVLEPFLQELLKQNKDKLASLVEEFKEKDVARLVARNSKCAGRSPESLFPLPFQRLGKYPLLFRELEKVVSPSRKRAKRITTVAFKAASEILTEFNASLPKVK